MTDTPPYPEYLTMMAKIWNVLTDSVYNLLDIETVAEHAYGKCEGDDCAGTGPEMMALYMPMKGWLEAPVTYEEVMADEDTSLVPEEMAEMTHNDLIFDCIERVGVLLSSVAVYFHDADALPDGYELPENLAALLEARDAQA